jgi:Xaa-Pro aminopeptidase
LASDWDSPERRIEERRRALGVDALLIHDPVDLRWASGFTGSNGLLLWGAEARHFVTDGRYAAQAATEVRGAQIHVPGYDLFGFLSEGGLAGGLRRVAFASDMLPVAAWERLRSLLPEIEWVGVTAFLSEARALKTDAEVETIRRAQRLTESVFSEVLGLMRPGMTEREVAAELTGRSLRGGADGMAFDPIVAVAERSALPHARPTDRVIAPGDPVLIDFGCTVQGYASDMTRMVSIGPPSDALVRVHGIVSAALAAAESSIVPGASCRDVDLAARRVIEEAGYGDRFPHSLGHGVGLSVHEYPAVSWRNEDPLPEGSVVTLEPGIYLPGAFGVRIEDMVRVLPTGPERLTAVDRDLVIL